MSSDPEACRLDALLSAQAEEEHYDKVREYEELFDRILECIKEALRLVAPEPDIEENNSWEDEQNRRLEILEDCVRKLVDLNQQRHAGGIGKGKAYAPIYKSLIKDIREYMKRNPHVSFSSARTECAAERDDISVSAAEKNIMKSDVMTPELEMLIRKAKSL